MREPRGPTRRRWLWLLLYAGGVVLLALGIVYWRLTRPTGFDQFEKKILQETNPIMERRAVRLAPHLPARAKPAPMPRPDRSAPGRPPSASDCPDLWRYPRLDAGVDRRRGYLDCSPRPISPAAPADLVHRAYHLGHWNPSAEATPDQARSCVPTIDAVARRELAAQDSGNYQPQLYERADTNLVLALAVRRQVLAGNSDQAGRLVLLLVEHLLKHESLPTTDLFSQSLSCHEAGAFAWLGTHPGIDPRILAQAQALLVEGRRSEEELRAHRVARILARKQQFEDRINDPSGRGSSVENTFHFILQGWPEHVTRAVLRPVALQALERAARGAIEMDPAQEARGERRLLATLGACNIVPPDGPQQGFTMGMETALEARFDGARFKRLSAYRYDLDLSPAYNAPVDYLAFVLACSRYQLEYGSLPADPHDLVPEFLPEAWWNDVTGYAELDIAHVPEFQAMRWSSDTGVQKAAQEFLCSTGRPPLSPEELQPYLPPGADRSVLASLFRPVPEQDVLLFRLRPVTSDQPGGEFNSGFSNWFDCDHLVRQPGEHDDALDQALMAPAE